MGSLTSYQMPGMDQDWMCHCPGKHLNKIKRASKTLHTQRPSKSHTGTQSKTQASGLAF